MQISDNQIYNIIPREVIQAIWSIEAELGDEIYVIGGVVRDLLLRRPFKKDIDIVTSGDGIRLASCLSEVLEETSKVSVFKNFGTAMFVFQGIQFEFVGARKESYSSSSRNPVVEPGTIRDDQMRRDFTVNAMAISLNSMSFGKLVDPFDGQKDLQNKILRTPLEPKTTYEDDPLRMFRAIRFATELHFEIEEKSKQAIAELKERVEILATERISDELNKIMAAKTPSKGFLLLKETGILPLILPEVSALEGVDEIEGQLHKDNFYHTLEVLDNMAGRTPNIWARWAALLHDIGKPPTKKFVQPTGWTFHNHEWIGAKMCKPIFKRLRLPLADKLPYVQMLVRYSSRPVGLANENCNDSAIRRLVFDTGDDLDMLFKLCYSDITTKNIHRKKRYYGNLDRLKERIAVVEEKDKIRNWQNPIDGKLIMQTFDIKPGEIIGVIKEKIKEAVLDGEIANEYAQAYAYMLKLGDSLKLKRR